MLQTCNLYHEKMQCKTFNAGKENDEKITAKIKAYRKG